MAVEIPLSRGLVALVDDEDAPALLKHSWHVSVQTGGLIYACRGGIGAEPSTVRMHRQIMNAPEGIIVDHIDRDGLHNRRSNLRIATWGQNQANAITWRGGYKGIDRLKYGWQARLAHNGVQNYLGCFRSAEEAARAYDVAARKFFGEFARLNFPNAGERSASPAPPFQNAVPPAKSIEVHLPNFTRTLAPALPRAPRKPKYLGLLARLEAGETAWDIACSVGISLARVDQIARWEAQNASTPPFVRNVPTSKKRNRMLETSPHREL